MNEEVGEAEWAFDQVQAFLARPARGPCETLNHLHWLMGRLMQAPDGVIDDVLAALGRPVLARGDRRMILHELLKAKKKEQADAEGKTWGHLLHDGPGLAPQEKTGPGEQ